MIPLSSGPENCADRRQSEIADVLALKIKDFEFRAGVLFVLRENLSAPKFSIFQDTAGLRDDFFPIVALVITSLSYEYAITRSIFVGNDINPSVVNGPAV